MINIKRALKAALLFAALAALAFGLYMLAQRRGAEPDVPPPEPELEYESEYYVLAPSDGPDYYEYGPGYYYVHEPEEEWEEEEWEEEEWEEEEEREGDLMFFAQNEYILGVITGRSIREISLRLINMTDARLRINLPLGLYFLANSGHVQNMVLTESMSVPLAGRGSVNIIAAVACMNIDKDIPGAGDRFFPAMLAAGDPLIALLEAAQGHEFEVLQAAIWHLRDNPGRQAIMGALEYEDGTSAISYEDFDEAVRLVARAAG